MIPQQPPPAKGVAGPVEAPLRPGEVCSSKSASPSLLATAAASPRPTKDGHDDTVVLGQEGPLQLLPGIIPPTGDAAAAAQGSSSRMGPPADLAPPAPAGLSFEGAAPKGAVSTAAVGEEALTSSHAGSADLSSAPSLPLPVAGRTHLADLLEGKETWEEELFAGMSVEAIVGAVKGEVERQKEQVLEDIRLSSLTTVRLSVKVGFI